MYIYGKKVLLRGIEKDDLESMQKAINAPELEQYESSAYFPISYEKQKIWFDRQLLDNEEKMIIDYQGDAVGLISLKSIDWINRSAWIGIKVFLESDRGKGIGTDALMAIEKFSFFSLNLNRLETIILENNPISEHVFVDKCGWKHEGVKRSYAYKNGRYLSGKMVSVLKQEYENFVNEKNYWGEGL